MSLAVEEKEEAQTRTMVRRVQSRTRLPMVRNMNAMGRGNSRERFASRMIWKLRE